MTNAYEIANLKKQEREEVFAMLVDEEEFYRIDGGDEGYLHTYELFRRGDKAIGIKCTSVNKNWEEDSSVTFGSLIKCKNCKTIHMVFDDVDEYCWVCDTDMVIKYRE
jgi:hypothetical protein